MPVVVLSLMLRRQFPIIASLEKQKVWKKQSQKQNFCFCECCWTKVLDLNYQIYSSPTHGQWSWCQSASGYIMFYGFEYILLMTWDRSSCGTWFVKKMYTQGCYWRAKKRTTRFFLQMYTVSWCTCTSVFCYLAWKET